MIDTTYTGNQWECAKCGVVVRLHNPNGTFGCSCGSTAYTLLAGTDPEPPKKPKRTPMTAKEYARYYYRTVTAKKRRAAQVELYRKKKGAA